MAQNRTVNTAHMRASKSGTKDGRRSEKDVGTFGKKLLRSRAAGGSGG